MKNFEHILNIHFEHPWVYLVSNELMNTDILELACTDLTHLHVFQENIFLTWAWQLVSFLLNLWWTLFQWMTDMSNQQSWCWDETSSLPGSEFRRGQVTGHRHFHYIRGVLNNDSSLSASSFNFVVVIEMRLMIEFEQRMECQSFLLPPIDWVVGAKLIEKKIRKEKKRNLFELNRAKSKLVSRWADGCPDRV